MSEEEKEEVKRRGKRVSGDLLEIVGKFPSRKMPDDESDVTKIFDEQIKLLAKQAKAKMLKKVILEQEKEISELDKIVNKDRVAEERRMAINTPTNHMEIDLKVATELAKLPDDEREKVIKTFAMLRAAEREAANPNMLLPLLIGFARENKGTSQNDMYQWAKMQLEAMKTAFDMAKSGEKSDGSNAINMYLQLFKEILEKDRELRRQEFEMMMKKLEETRQPGLLDSILLNEDVRKILKEIGLFNPQRSSGLDPRIQIELERLKMQHEKELKKMEMEFQLKLQELQNEQNKMALLTQGIRQIGAAAASALSEETLSENPTETFQRKPLIQEEKPSEEGELVTLQCPKCGGDITFPKTAEIVTCPHCGSKFKVKKKE